MWNLKYNSNEHIYETNKKRLTDIENRISVAKGRESQWGGMDWEFAGNKVLL